MTLKSLLSFIVKTPVRLMFRVDTLTREFNRAVFVSAALSEGIIDILSERPRTCEEIMNIIGSDMDSKGLQAWLDLGVSLGELKKGPDGYRIAGYLSKQLSNKSYDAYGAYLQARVEAFYHYVLKTPAFVKENRRFEPDEAHGELFARSSKTTEPLVLDLVDRIIPTDGQCKLLEVGCGSAVYIVRACERNPELTAIGLELHRDIVELAETTVKKHGVGDRVSIRVADVRNFEADSEFDLITLHNLIYYFPEHERPALFSRLFGFLKPGGTLVMTTLCQGPAHAFRLMNLWSTMSEGYGPLPIPNELTRQLNDGGFHEISRSSIIPSYYSFQAVKPD